MGIEKNERYTRRAKASTCREWRGRGDEFAVRLCRNENQSGDRFPVESPFREYLRKELFRKKTD